MSDVYTALESRLNALIPKYHNASADIIVAAESSVTTRVIDATTRAWRDILYAGSPVSITDEKLNNYAKKFVFEEEDTLKERVNGVLSRATFGIGFYEPARLEFNEEIANLSVFVEELGRKKKQNSMMIATFYGSMELFGTSLGYSFGGGTGAAIGASVIPFILAAIHKKQDPVRDFTIHKLSDDVKRKIDCVDRKIAIARANRNKILLP